MAPNLAALMALLSVCEPVAAQWALGPVLNEDMVQQIRVINVGASRTVAWAIGWENAVRIAYCPNVEQALRDIIAANPQLASAAQGSAILAALDQRLIKDPPLTSADGTRLPPAEWLLDGQGRKWTMSGRQALVDGGDSGGWGTPLAFRGGSIYLKTIAGLWMRWNGTGWVTAPSGFEP